MEKRYIKTEIDGSASILKINSCNLCPFFMYMKSEGNTRCAKYFSPSSKSNITCPNIYSYTISNNNAFPIQSIDIPVWCGLHKTKETVKEDKNLYIRNGQNRYMEIPTDDKNLVTLSSLFVDYDKNLNKLVYVTDTPNTPYKYLMNEEKETSLPPFDVTDSYKVKRECSCCGDNKEDIDRTKNLGMCTTCWEQYKDNEEYKYFAFINNFRLKRKSTWTDVISKKIKEVY